MPKITRTVKNVSVIFTLMGFQNQQTPYLNTTDVTTTDTVNSIIKKKLIQLSNEKTKFAFTVFDIDKSGEVCPLELGIFVE